MTELRYPCIRFNKDSIMYSGGLGRVFDRIAVDYIPYWSNPPRTVVVDEAGRALRLKGIRSSRPSFNPLNWFTKAPTRIVTWDAEDLGVWSLDDLKQQLVRLVVDSGWFSQSWENEKEFRARLNKAGTYRELFEQANYFGKWRG